MKNYCSRQPNIQVENLNHLGFDDILLKNGSFSFCCSFNTFKNYIYFLYEWQTEGINRKCILEKIIQRVYIF